MPESEASVPALAGPRVGPSTKTAGCILHTASGVPAHRVGLEVQVHRLGRVDPWTCMTTPQIRNANAIPIKLTNKLLRIQPRPFQHPCADLHDIRPLRLQISDDTTAMKNEDPIGNPE